jgi:hypothetical protein
MTMPIMSIQYDYDKREIRIPVRVYKENSEDEELKVLTPPVAITPGNWDLYWVLDTESCGFASFDAPGVTKCNEGDVQHLKLSCMTKEPGYNCWAKVHNSVTEANGCRVWLNFLPKGGGVGNGKPFSHDPTIAVTLDPVGDRGKHHCSPAAEPALTLKA